MRDFKSSTDLSVTENTVEQIADLIHAATSPEAAPTGYEPGKPFIVVPENHKVLYLPYLPEKPQRIRGAASFGAIESFARYVNEFKSDATHVFATRGDGSCKFTAHLDFHTPKDPSHCTHTATFVPALSLEWGRWSKANGAKMDQETFAKFIEDNLPDIASPSGADLLQIATQLEIDGTVTFKRGTKLSNGTVNFEFKNEQTSKSGSLSIPEVFVLNIPVYDQEPPQRVDVRFRHKLESGGTIQLWFEIVDPVRLLNQAAERAAKEFDTLTGIKPFTGSFSNQANY